MEFTSWAVKIGTVHFEKGLTTKFIGVFIHTPVLLLVYKKYRAPLHAAKCLKMEQLYGFTSWSRNLALFWGIIV